MFVSSLPCFPPRDKEKTSSCCLVVKISACRCIEQRFVPSRFSWHTYPIFMKRCLTNRKMMKLTMELIVCVGYFGTCVCKMMSLLLSS